MAEPARKLDFNGDEKQAEAKPDLRVLNGGGESNSAQQRRLKGLGNRRQRPSKFSAAKSSPRRSASSYDKSNPNNLRALPSNNMKEPGGSSSKNSNYDYKSKPFSPEQINAAETSPGQSTGSYDKSNPNNLRPLPSNNMKESGSSGGKDSSYGNLNKSLSPDEVNAAESSPGRSAGSYDKSNPNGLHLVPGDKTEESKAGNPIQVGGGKAQTENDAESLGLDQVGKGFTGAAAAGGPEATMVKKAAKIVLNNANKHKKGLAIGGVVGGSFILIITAGIAFIVSHEILTIEADVVRVFTEIEHDFENKVDNDMLRHALCQEALGCNGGQADEPIPPGDGEPLAGEMKDFNFDDPAIKSSLANQDISVAKDATTGKVTLTDDRTGQPITADDLTNDADLAERVQTAVPGWDADQMTGFISTEADNAAATFSGLKNTEDEKTADQEIEDDVTEGDTQVDAVDTSTTESANPNTELTTNDGTLGAAINAEDTALASGENAAQATQAGLNVLESGETVDVAEGSFDIAGPATAACVVEKTVNTADIARIPTIVSLLIRHASTFLSIADQLKTGHITGSAINSTMQLLNGNPDATVSPQDKGTAYDATLPFAATSTWATAIGKPVTSGTPGMLASALPTANSAQLILNEIDGVLTTTGLNGLCGALTSTFGIVIQLGIGLGELATNLGDFGGTEAAQVGISLAAFLTLDKVVLPDVLNYFSPVGLSGAEDSAQFMNNTGGGLTLASSDFSRSLGGEPLHKSEADILSAEANQQNQIAEANLPWTQRVFSMNNPQSLVSNLALDLPLSLNQLVSKVGNYLTGLPSALMRTVSSIFSGHIAFALTQAQYPGSLYDVTAYGYTDSDLEPYDPITNENYLYSTQEVPAQWCRNVLVKKKLVRTCTAEQYSVVRIAALGNPTNDTFDVNYGNTVENSLEVYSSGSVFDPTNQAQLAGEPDTLDLLHCYIDGFVPLQENNSGVDHNCGGLGSYDADPNPNSTTLNENPYYMLPNGYTAATVYCSVPPPTPWIEVDGGIPTCATDIENQTKDDVTHFRQYLLDTNVMKSLDGLTN